MTNLAFRLKTLNTLSQPLINTNDLLIDYIRLVDCAESRRLLVEVDLKFILNGSKEVFETTLKMDRHVVSFEEVFRYQPCWFLFSYEDVEAILIAAINSLKITTHDSEGTLIIADGSKLSIGIQCNFLDPIHVARFGRKISKGIDVSFY